MEKHPAVSILDTMQKMFNRTVSVLDDADSAFMPAEGMYNTAQQLRHTWMTLDWFTDASHNAGAFDLDFEEHERKVREAGSVEREKAEFDAAVQRAREHFGGLTAEQLQQHMPDNPVFVDTPVFDLVGAIADHTSHHRGSLAVYARLRGKQPPMPYDDLE